VIDGCEIREMPDGGREFVLEEPSLTFVRIDDQSHLQFGQTEVVIGSPFEVEIGGLAYHLDPRNTSHLGPFVSLFPGSVRWLWTSAGGRLTAVFRSGARLIVTPDALIKAWSVGSVYCMPSARS
jgi:hypothetical protein